MYRVPLLSCRYKFRRGASLTATNAKYLYSLFRRHKARSNRRHNKHRILSRTSILDHTYFLVELLEEILDQLIVTTIKDDNIGLGKSTGSSLDRPHSNQVGRPVSQDTVVMVPPDTILWNPPPHPK